jgi:putrescine transport system substrate-binding protein
MMVEAIKPIREYISTFDNANYLTDAAQSGVVCANTWSGDYGVAKARAAEAGIELNLGYFIPEDRGAGLVRPLGDSGRCRKCRQRAQVHRLHAAPRSDRGLHQFYRLCQCLNKAAMPFVDPAIAADPAVYPDAEAMARLYTPIPQTAEQESDLNRAWTEIKTGG